MSIGRENAPLSTRLNGMEHRIRFKDGRLVMCAVSIQQQKKWMNRDAFDTAFKKWSCQ